MNPQEQINRAVELGVLEPIPDEPGRYKLASDFCMHLATHIAVVDRHAYESLDGYIGMLRRWKNPPRDDEMQEMGNLIAVFAKMFLMALERKMKDDDLGFTDKADRMAGEGT